MKNISIKRLTIIAVIIGVIAGMSAALVKSTVENNSVALADATSQESDQNNPFGPDHELSSLTGEHDPTWLLEGVLGGFQNIHPGSSSDPELLRSLLEDQGIDVPEGASTHDLQNMLSGSQGTFDHARE